MRYRFMRVMIFFDLPVKTAAQRKNYRIFRKKLLEEGFLMIQESVYVRIVVDRDSARFLEERVAGFAPPKGIVQSLIVTEKQYASMRFFVGGQSTDVRKSDARTVVI